MAGKEQRTLKDSCVRIAMNAMLSRKCANTFQDRKVVAHNDGDYDLVELLSKQISYCKAEEQAYENALDILADHCPELVNRARYLWSDDNEKV